MLVHCVTRVIPQTERRRRWTAIASDQSSRNTFWPRRTELTSSPASPSPHDDGVLLVGQDWRRHERKKHEDGDEQPEEEKPEISHDHLRCESFSFARLGGMSVRGVVLYKTKEGTARL